MLQLSDAVLQKPVLSLQTGAPVGTTLSIIVNPNNLKIEGFYCQDRFEKKVLILLTQDIRDILPQGIVVNDHHALTEPDELVRLKNILDLKFELINKPVYTTTKTRVGKISDYALDDNGLYIQKLYVARSILKSFGTAQLSIDRNDIVEITSRKIVINDILKTAANGVPNTVPAS